MSSIKQGQLQGIFIFSQTEKYPGLLFCTFLHQWCKCWLHSCMLHGYSLEVCLDLSWDVFGIFLLSYHSKVVIIHPFHLNPLLLWDLAPMLKKSNSRCGLTENAIFVNNSLSLSSSVLPKLVYNGGCSGPVPWGPAVPTLALGQSPALPPEKELPLWLLCCWAQVTQFTNSCFMLSSHE